MVPLVYREVPPPGALADRVSCLWWVGPVAGSAGASQGAATLGAEAGRTILPDGSVDLVWHDSTLTVAGPDTFARRSGPGGSRAMGVRLRPGAAATLGPSGGALRDEHPSAEELWGPEGRRLQEAVAEGSDDRARLALLTAAVCDRAAHAPPTDPAVALVVALLARGGVGVAEAAREAGVGERLLRRRFAEHVGYGPKTLDRVLRLQRLLGLAITTDEGLAGLAALAGYADQAHLSREARALAGTTASALVTARRPA